MDSTVYIYKYDMYSDPLQFFACRFITNFMLQPDTTIV